MVIEMLRDVLASKTITEQGSKLGHEITANVISDKQFQEKAGSAIWSAVKHAVTPRMLLSSTATGSENAKEHLHSTPADL